MTTNLLIVSIVLCFAEPLAITVFVNWRKHPTWYKTAKMFSSWLLVCFTCADDNILCNKSSSATSRGGKFRTIAFNCERSASCPPWCVGGAGCDCVIYDWFRDTDRIKFSHRQFNQLFWCCKNCLNLLFTQRTAQLRGWKSDSKRGRDWWRTKGWKWNSKGSRSRQSNKRIGKKSERKFHYNFHSSRCLIFPADFLCENVILSNAEIV